MYACAPSSFSCKITLKHAFPLESLSTTSFRMVLLYPTSVWPLIQPPKPPPELYTLHVLNLDRRLGDEGNGGWRGGAGRLRGPSRGKEAHEKRKRSLCCRETEQEIVVWGIICGEQEEKSNHNLKGLVWRGAIYERMRLKALSFFLSACSAPSGSRVADAERGWRDEERENWQWLEWGGCQGFTYMFISQRGFNMKSAGYQWFSHMTHCRWQPFFFFF